jgi:ribosomal-protein-alanine N-acetyltransferase
MTGFEIVRVSEGLEQNLGAFFEEIAQDPASQHFHPHPFSRAFAKEIACYRGSDLFCVACAEDRILAYGMLRGWDDGYDVPSLGLYVSGVVRGVGVGRLMLEYLHTTARLRGCSAVRLSVYRDNLVARSLYESAGYVFKQEEGEELVGTFLLSRRYVNALPWKS